MHGDLRSDFIATHADARSHGGIEVGGRSTEVRIHFVDGMLDDARRGTAPARMNGGDNVIM